MMTQQSINIMTPDLISNTGIISVMNTPVNHTVEMGPLLAGYLARDLLGKELLIVKEKASSIIDYGRLQEMVNSGDGEMNNLAYSILDQYSKYASRLLRQLKAYPSCSTYAVENIINEYLMSNKTNIIGDTK